MSIESEFYLCKIFIGWLMSLPGMTMINIGRILRKPAMIVDPLAWAIFFAARTRWTITWSAHQYLEHIDTKISLLIGTHLYLVYSGLPVPFVMTPKVSFVRTILGTFLRPCLFCGSTEGLSVSLSPQISQSNKSWNIFIEKKKKCMLTLKWLYRSIIDHWDI